MQLVTTTVTMATSQHLAVCFGQHEDVVFNWLSGSYGLWCLHLSVVLGLLLSFLIVFFRVEKLQINQFKIWTQKQKVVSYEQCSAILEDSKWVFNYPNDFEELKGPDILLWGREGVRERGRGRGREGEGESEREEPSDLALSVSMDRCETER